jgi:exonuclease III
MNRTRPCPAPPENAVRWLDVDLPEYGFGLGALHILTLTPGIGDVRSQAMRRMWSAVLEAAVERFAEPFIFIGDLNTGLRRIDESSSTFQCAEHFGRRADSGWTDAWRHFNGNTFEPTWISTAGDGFRLDHAFVSPSLLPRVRTCYYSHGERGRGFRITRCW